VITITRCQSEYDYSQATRLVTDYIQWLNIDLSFQGINDELSDFATMYGNPGGLFLLARREGTLVGGVGLRGLEPKLCEMKRLYVYDEFKGMGAGRKLCLALIHEARRLGYERMRLDTLDRMVPARGLYESLGFRPIAPYRPNPDPSTVYMELDLGSEYTPP